MCRSSEGADPFDRVAGTVIDRGRGAQARGMGQARRFNVNTDERGGSGYPRCL